MCTNERPFKLTQIAVKPTPLLPNDYEDFNELLDGLVTLLIIFYKYLLIHSNKTFKYSKKKCK